MNSKIKIIIGFTYLLCLSLLLYYIFSKYDLKDLIDINFLKENEVYPVFHYLSLHQSEFYINKHDGRDLPNADKFTDCLLRMPLYYDISSEDILRISNLISDYENKNTR